MSKKQLSPDAANGGTTTTTQSTSKRRLPRKDADLATLGQSAAEAWANDPDLTLKWITQKAYQQLTDRYATNLNRRLAAGSDRPDNTATLEETNKTIDKGISRVKKLLIAKYDDEKKAIAQYARYGIERKGKAYVFPRDNDKRAEALKLVLPALQADGFDSDSIFGKTAWTKAINNYKAALKASVTTTKTVSATVGDKDTDKEQVREVLKALLLLLEANYPKNFDVKCREWGFLKQNY